MFIQIVGITGSGKTTLAKKLAKSLNAPYVDLDLFLDNSFLVRGVKDRKRWSFATGVSFLFQRVKEYQKIKERNKTVVIDQGIDTGVLVYSKNAFRQGVMLVEEYKLLRDLHHQLIKNLRKPNVTIYLKISVDTILKRIKLRKRNHEKYYSRNYLVGLNKCMSEYIVELEKLKTNIIQYNVDSKQIVYKNSKLMSKYAGLINVIKKSI